MELARPDLAFAYQYTTGPFTSRPTGREVYALADYQLFYDSSCRTLYGRYRDLVEMRCHIETGKTHYCLRETAKAIEAASRLLFTLPLIELLRQRSLFNIHAAGLCRQGKAVILAGPSGAGKSTLALALFRAGWGFMGDDMLFAESMGEGGLRLRGLPGGIECPQASVPLFTNPPLFPRSGLTGKQHLETPDPQLEAQPGALVLLKVAHQRKSVLTRIHSSHAFTELAPNVILTDIELCRRHFRILAELSGSIPAWQLLTGTDLGETEKLLREAIA